MSGIIPAFSTLTPENHAAVVITVNYAFIIITIVFVAVRIITTFLLKRQFSWDDALLMLAVAIGVAQSVVVERSASSALGRHIGKVSLVKLNKYYKFAYAGSILSLFAQACAKSSAVCLMKRLSATHSTLHGRFPFVHGAVVVWLIFSIFALAFQCQTPRPWVYSPADRCVGSGAMWYPVLTLNILTDAVLSVIFIPSVYKLQMRLSQRVGVIGWFGSRIFVCIFTIAQLATTIPAWKSSDITRKMVIPVVLGQCVMNLSILTAAAPSLHRFFNELHSQGFNTAIPSTQIELSQAQGSQRNKSWTKASLPSAGSGQFQHSKRNSETQNSTNNQDFNSTKSKDSEIMPVNNSHHYNREDEENPNHITNLNNPTTQRLSDGRQLIDSRPDIMYRGQSFITHDPHQSENDSGASDVSDTAIIRQIKTWDVRYDDRVNPHEIGLATTTTNPSNNKHQLQRSHRHSSSSSRGNDIKIRVPNGTAHPHQI